MSLDFDPYSNEWKLDPYPAYRKLRVEAPVHLSPETHTWCISRHQDVETVLMTPEVFSSRVASASRQAEIAAMGPLEKARMAVRLLLDMHVTPWEASRARVLIGEDGAVHHAMRTIANRGFTPRRVRIWEERIDGLVAEYLEGTKRMGCFDLIRELAVPLPVTVIAEMLGVQPEHMDRFKQWSDAIVRLVGGPSMGADLFSSKSLIEMRKYMMPIVKARRANQEDDLISTLLMAEPGDEPLSDFELLLFFVLLLVAGNETTRHTISHGLIFLNNHPDQLEEWHANPAGISEVATEEILRASSVTMHFRRTATIETSIRGIPIAAGDRVVMWYTSANYDEDAFVAPFDFDLKRKPNNHVTFGTGRHVCLGAALARLEVRVVFEELLSRISGFELTGPPDRLRSNFISGIKHLPVRVALA